MDKDKKYNHVEAFCLMTYICSECGTRELIWNSRDGVTPFTISCRNCNGEMQHTHWQLDKREENYIPSKNQRVFINLPEELKAPLLRSKIERVKLLPMFKKSPRTDEELFQIYMNDFNEGEPYLITM